MDLQNKISFDTTGAVASVKALSKALRSYNSAVAGVTKSPKDVKSLATGFKDVEKAADKAGKTLDKTGKKGKDAADKMNKAAGQAVLTWKSVARITVMQVAHQGISKLVSSFHEATEAARDYGKAVAEIQTIGPQFGDADALSNQLKALSAEKGFGLDETAAGMYQTLSNQVAGLGDEFTFMGTAATLAIAGVSSLDDSVNLLSSAINSYGSASAESADIAGKMFKAVELGRFKIEDIANSYGRVTGLSAQLGVSISEINASLATLTTSGMDSNEAMTLLINTQLKLIKPSEKLKAVFKGMGIASAEAGIQAYGFQGLLQKISDSAGGSATELAKMYGRVRALRGALGLTGLAAIKYAENLKKIQEAGKHTAEEAALKILQTDAKQLEIEFNRVAIASVNFGEKFNSVLLKVIKSAGGATEAIQAISAAAVFGIITYGTIKAATAIKAYTTSLVAARTALVATQVASTGTTAALIGTTAATSAATIATRSATTGFVAMAASARAAAVAMLFSPVGWAVAAAAAVASLVVVYNHLSKAAERAAEAQKELNNVKRQNALDETIKRVRKEKEAYGELAAELQIVLQEKIKLENLAATETAQKKAFLFGDIKTQLSDQTSAIDAYFSFIESKAKDAEQAIHGLNNAINGVNTNISDFKFERRMKNAGDATKEVNARLKRSAGLQNNSLKLMVAGHEDLAKLDHKRALAQAKSALAVADATDDTKLQEKTAKAVEKAMENENKLLEIKKTKTQEIANIARSESIANKQTLSNLKIITDEISKLSEVTPDMTDAEVEERLKRLGELTKQLADEKKKVKGTKLFALLDIQDKIEALVLYRDATKSAYDVMTQDTVDWGKAVIDVFKEVAETQRSYLPGKDARVEALVGPGSGKKQQAALVEQGKVLDRGATATINYATAQRNIGKAVDENTISLSAFRDIAIHAGKYGKVELASAATVWNKLAESTKVVNTGIAEGTTKSKEFEAALQAIRVISAGLTGTEAGGLVASIVKNIESATAQAQGLKDLQKDIDAGEEITKKVEIITESDVKEKVDEASASMETLQDKTVTARGNADTSQVDALARSIANLRDKQVNINIHTTYTSSGKPSEAKFGRLFRASGGDARGTDTIPAMLSPGEFVMNAGATKRMYSQLVSANAGQRYLGSGGNSNTTFNNNFNITGSDAPQQTARQIQKLLKRENRIRK